MDNDKLAAMDKAATQGVWDHFQSTMDPNRYYISDGRTAIFASEIGATKQADLELVTTLVNLYRAGKLVPVSLDTDTAALVERLEYTERHGLFNAVVNDCYASYGQAANALRTITAERDEARAEVLEQARLNGMGSEREAKLMAERDALQKRVEGLEGQLEQRDSFIVDQRLGDAFVRQLPRALIAQHKGTGA